MNFKKISSLSTLLHKLNIKSDNLNILLSQANKATDTRAMAIILHSLGLSPRNIQESILDRAAIYLSEGITDKNLTLAALSIVAMISGHQETFNVLKYGNSLSSKSLLDISNKIERDFERISAIFYRLRDEKIANFIKEHIIHGELLTFYVDRMLDCLKKWCHNIESDIESDETSNPTP